ncbi:MAG: radical SAM family heme chaperone HemW [Cellulosilyticaceae bacterium]
MKIGLYVHIPFCKSKCYYCDFLSFSKTDKMEQYIEALRNEIEWYGNSVRGKHTIRSIFIGGGTPTVLPPFLIEKLCQTLTEKFEIESDCEWSIEVNPGTITKEHIDIFEKVGINRVSIGLQACQNTLLKQIGRIHDYSDWEETIELLQKSKINNISTDLMFGLPGQTLLDWKNTLKKVINANVKHISAYSLIIEEGTYFSKLDEEGKLTLPSEDVEREMYQYAKMFLKKNAFEHYEISNWAKPGYISKHNTSYWKQIPYIGVGLGAHGYLDNIRTRNTRNMESYLINNGMPDLIRRIESVQTVQMDMEEYMFLGLRMIEGISIKEFYNRFNVDLFEIYGDTLNGWIKQKKMVNHNGSIYLTEEGIDVSNQIFMSFLME